MKTLSKFNVSETDAPEAVFSPVIKAIGAATPPAAEAAKSHFRSCMVTGALRGAENVLLKTYIADSPIPEPRYNKPAKSIGCMPDKSNLAKGALAPNVAAAAKA